MSLRHIAPEFSFVEMAERLAANMMRHREAVLREMVERTIGPSHPESGVEMIAAMDERGMEARVLTWNTPNGMEGRFEILAGCDVVEQHPMPVFRFATQKEFQRFP